MARPLQILHIVDTLGNGGLENGLVNLIQRLDPDRFQHVVCAMRALGVNAGRLPRERVRVMCLAERYAPSRLQAHRLAAVIREVKPDIVHSRNWGAIEGIVAAKWAGVSAAVHSEHGVDSDRRPPLRQSLCRRFAFGLADAVITVSEDLRRFHTRWTRLGRERITVIHNGVDTERFAANASVRATVRQELGLAEDDFCIGAVGNLFVVKDHATLLRAYAEFARAHRQSRLLVIGAGPELVRLEEAARSCPDAGSRVTFLGATARVPEFLNAMDAYVLPSIKEGISNSLLEAMATGLPVIATETGGNPEVIAHGQSGFLFPVGDWKRLLDLLTAFWASASLRQNLGQHAFDRVRSDFSIGSMVRNYAHMYESVAAVRPAAVGLRSEG